MEWQARLNALVNVHWLCEALVAFFSANWTTTQQKAHTVFAAEDTWHL